MTHPLALILLLATLAFVLAPFVTPPFTGYDPGQFPVEILRPAIQPAGYAFAIWSVIYLWLVLHAGFGLVRRQAHPAWVRVRPALTVSIVLGTLWLAIAAASPIWATVVILVMAVTAVVAFVNAPMRTDRWLLSAPLAIYAGWLTAAAGVSVGVLVAGYGVAGNEQSAMWMMGLVLALGLVIQSRRPGMPVYGLTLVWALVGIVAANWGSGTWVAWVALACAVAVLAATLRLWQRG